MKWSQLKQRSRPPSVYRNMVRLWLDMLARQERDRERAARPQLEARSRLELVVVPCAASLLSSRESLMSIIPG